MKCVRTRHGAVRRSESGCRNPSRTGSAENHNCCKDELKKKKVRLLEAEPMENSSSREFQPSDLTASSRPAGREEVRFTESMADREGRTRGKKALRPAGKRRFVQRTVRKLLPQRVRENVRWGKEKNEASTQVKKRVHEKAKEAVTSLQNRLAQTRPGRDGQESDLPQCKLRPQPENCGPIHVSKNTRCGPGFKSRLGGG